MANSYDVAVIGAGPGGYVAAIRCAQLGLKTVCIDEWVNEKGAASPGGTCLNVGCIPSKAMIESSELYAAIGHEFADHGIEAGAVKLKLADMLKRKDRVVHELTSGVAALFQANKITFVHGTAHIDDATHLTAQTKDGKKESIEARYIIIATGSTPRELPIAPYDHETIVDSTGALAFSKVPKKLGIIGAGVIALELGSVWNRLGADVTLFKTSEGLLPELEADISKLALKNFEQQGLKFEMGVKTEASKVSAKQVELSWSRDGKTQKSKFDKLIIAIGRVPNSAGIFDPKCGVTTDDRGFIEVDAQCRTKANNIFAIGDLVRGPMLAHKASEEGVMVAELIAGHHAQLDLATVPSVIYTRPEIAWVGQTEQQCKDSGIAINIGTFPFNANGRARAIGQTDGIVKVIADAKTDRILGVHIMGPQASELIMQAKIAMDFKASSEDLAMTMFAHPTLSEALHEAMLSVDQRAIHAVQAKKRKS
jgi:dihydrolipoamide dehydrogenase